jgi:hypothetical protein
MNYTDYEQNLINAVEQKTAELIDILTLGLQNGYTVDINLIVDYSDLKVKNKKITIVKGDTEVYINVP